MNLLAIFGAALIPMIVGAVYYGPLFGNAWMKEVGKTKEELEGGNMLVIFGVSYFLSVLLALGLTGMTNHQQGLTQLFAMHPDYLTAGTEVGDLYASVMDKFGDAHTTFGHGALHGAIASVLLFLPLIAIVALFERKSAKYIGINFLYWLITLTLMGGVICPLL